MIIIGSTIKSFALPGNGTGKVLRKYNDEKGANGEDLYEIIDENGEIHSMVPSLFDKDESIIENVTNQTNLANNNNSIENIKIEIEQAINDIIKQLDLKESSDTMIQLRNCCLVQKYIVEHNTYNEDIMKEKEGYKIDEIAILDLYNAVVLHNGVCTSNSLMFKKILEKVGVKSEVVGLISNDTGGMHASNIVELDGQYYFFDSTLETTIYESNSRDGSIVLCCAGLGKNEYCQFYTPKLVLPDNPTDNVKPVPTNISEYRIPSDIVNNLIIKPSEHNIKH